MSPARAMVLRGLHAAVNVQTVTFRVTHYDVTDDFSQGWRQLDPLVQQGWEELAALLASTPPDLLVPRDSPLLSETPKAEPEPA